MTMKSMKSLDAKLFLHPVVGMTKPGDVDHYTRVRCYQHVIKKYHKDDAMLALLPLAMRMGGPREALLHAIKLGKIMVVLILLLVEIMQVQGMIVKVIHFTAHMMRKNY